MSVFTPPDPFITEKNWDEYPPEAQAIMKNVNGKGVILGWDKYITELRSIINEREQMWDMSQTSFTPFPYQEGKPFVWDKHIIEMRDAIENIPSHFLSWKNALNKKYGYNKWAQPIYPPDEYDLYYYCIFRNPKPTFEQFKNRWVVCNPKLWEELVDWFQDTYPETWEEEINDFLYQEYINFDDNHEIYVTDARPYMFNPIRMWDRNIDEMRVCLKAIKKHFGFSSTLMCSQGNKEFRDGYDEEGEPLPTPSIEEWTTPQMEQLEDRYDSGNIDSLDITETSSQFWFPGWDFIYWMRGEVQCETTKFALYFQRYPNQYPDAPCYIYSNVRIFIADTRYSPITSLSFNLQASAQHTTGPLNNYETVFFATTINFEVKLYQLSHCPPTENEKIILSNLCKGNNAPGTSIYTSSITTSEEGEISESFTINNIPPEHSAGVGTAIIIHPTNIIGIYDAPFYRYRYNWPNYPYFDPDYHGYEGIGQYQKIQLKTSSSSFEVEYTL
ncbi:MAG: hypothetical protein DRH33_03290 [Candidatus Nealsonbacteria bacterium]|nr:MAG: hypothetical protein DRH33_03290 [Candidatus Nealsonbacteria bacterium]